MNNAIGYRRLSERDQSKYSLDYQQNAIDDYCKRFNLNLIGCYTDNGQSSATFDRPDYKALESFINKNAPFGSISLSMAPYTSKKGYVKFLIYC